MNTIFSTASLGAIMRTLLPIFVAILISGCGGPYDDLEAAYGASESGNGATFLIQTIVVTSTKFKAVANSYEKIFSARLAPGSIEIEPVFPFSITKKTLHIPVTDITGCSKACFGEHAWDAELLLEKSGVDIRLRNSQQIIDWCWDNKIPMIPAKDKRQWLYEGAKLPDRSKFSEQLSARENYDHQAKMSCLGY